MTQDSKENSFPKQYSKSLTQDILKKDSIKNIHAIKVVKKEEITLKNKTFLNHKIVETQTFLNTLYSEDLSIQVIDEQIETLVELTTDFEGCIDKIYLNKLDANIIVKIANILEGMKDIFIFIDTLRNLTNVFNNLSILLYGLNFDSLSKEKKDKLKILEFIYDDISRFVYTVFVYRDNVDVHYLEDSLHSSYEQLKMNILDENIKEEELELF